jgi:hypothetical protein
MTSDDTLKGLGIVLGLVFGPVIVGWVLTAIALSVGINSLANFAFGLAMFWSFLLLPIWGVTPLPVALQRGGLMLAISFAQWSIVGLLVAHWTIGGRFLRVRLVGLSGVVGVALLTHMAIRMLGLKVIFEGP